MMLVIGIFHIFTIPESYLIERLLIGSGCFTLNMWTGSFVFAANYLDQTSAMLRWQMME
jgi:hypothetical protein